MNDIYFDNELARALADRQLTSPSFFIFSSPWQPIKRLLQAYTKWVDSLMENVTQHALVPVYCAEFRAGC